MKKYYELVTTWYNDEKVTSNIYETEWYRKPAKCKHKDLIYTVEREYFESRIEAEKMRNTYLNF